MTKLTINHILTKTSFSSFGLHGAICRRQYGSATKLPNYQNRWNNVKWRPLRRSKSFQIIPSAPVESLYAT